MIEEEMFVKKMFKNKIFPKIQETNFINKNYSIDEFGAISGGKVKNIGSINKAIDFCSSEGGGTVLIPKGVWLSGPIVLKDNVNLHLEKGAVLKFSSDLEDYNLIKTNYEGANSVRFQSPISGSNLTNIAITGRGIIDGSGDRWRLVKKFKMTDKQWEKLLASGGAITNDGQIWWPSKAALNGAKLVAKLNELRKEGREIPLNKYREAGEYLRPVLLSLINCKKILLDGPTFQNSPSWNIHPLMSEDIIIRNLTVRNPWYAQNGDGIDIDSCKNVKVENCNFDVGDDAICLKSGKDKEGRLRNQSSENIYIIDCIVYHGHGGFVIGSEMSGGIRNVFVSDCVFVGTDIGVRFKSTRGRGGVVENIFINNLKMLDISAEAIKINLFYEDDGKRPIEVETVTEKTPVFHNLFFNNIICIGAEKAILIKGLPEMFVKNVNIENTYIKSDYGINCVFAKNVKLVNSDIDFAEGVDLEFEDSENIIINGVIRTKVKK